jgi:hypothetical protein
MNPSRVPFLAPGQVYSGHYVDGEKVFTGGLAIWSMDIYGNLWFFGCSYPQITW